MLNLVDAKGFEEEDFSIWNELLQKKLEEGKLKKQLINVGGIRAVGKTHSLIEFAKSNDYSIVIPNNFMSQMMKKKYAYEKIYYVDEFKHGSFPSSEKFIIDEGVDVNIFKGQEDRLITGYVVEKLDAKKDIEDIEASIGFYEEIILNLKKEAKALSRTLTNLSGRDKTDNMYIATVKSLRETLDLIHKYDWELTYDNSFDDGRSFINIYERNNEGSIRYSKVYEVIPRFLEDVMITDLHSLINTIKRCWNDLSDDQQNQIAEIFGGKKDKQKVLTIFHNVSV